MAADVESLARAQLAAERDGTVLSLAPEQVPADIDAAERVQDAYLRLWGRPAGAWKLGATVPRARIGLGLPRSFFGLVPTERTLASGISLDVSTLRQRVFELEIAFQMGATLTPDGDEPTDASVRAAVAGVCAAFELPQARHRSLGEFGGPALVADNGAGGYIVAGALRPDWSPEALANTTVRLSVGGAVVSEGDSSSVIDGPFGALVEFARQARARGFTLEAGQYVLTGACVAAIDPAGSPIVGEIEGVGEVSLELAGLSG